MWTIILLFNSTINSTINSTTVVELADASSLNLQIPEKKHRMANSELSSGILLASLRYIKDAVQFMECYYFLFFTVWKYHCILHHSLYWWQCEKNVMNLQLFFVRYVLKNFIMQYTKMGILLEHLSHFWKRMIANFTWTLPKKYQ